MQLFYVIEGRSSLDKHLNNIDDYCIRDGGPTYSWANLRDDISRVLARLDILYSFSSSIRNTSFHMMQSKILSDSNFYDHHLVSLIVNLSVSPPGGFHGKLMLGLFKKPMTQLKPFGIFPSSNAILF